MIKIDQSSNKQQLGFLNIISGPMFSGKTSELLKEIKKLIDSGISKEEILIIKPDIDKRYSKIDIITHNGKSVEKDLSLKVSVVPVDFELREFVIQKDKVKFIFLDEIQFFTSPSFVSDVKDLVIDWHMVIFGCGLDSDCFIVPFNHMPNLLAIADEVTKLKTVCHSCKSFTATKTKAKQKEILEHQPDGENNLVQVGGNDMYEAVCNNCY
jgi:thymidine kinase